MRDNVYCPDPNTVLYRLHQSARGNRNKWETPPSFLMPPHCPEWTIALRAVNKRIPGRNVVPKARAGLMYPDPAYMVSVMPKNRALALTAWLSVRAARCGQMLYPSSPHMPVIPATVWRKFFWITRPRSPASPLISVPSADRELDEAVAAAKAMFGGDMVASMNATSREVFWRGKAYEVVDGAVVDMESDVLQEIIWELAELNWRYEVLTLDKFAAPHLWRDEDAAGARTSAILAIFAPSASFVLTHAPFPTENSIISAATPAARLQAFTAFRRVMSHWPACPAHIKQWSADVVPPSSDSAEIPIVESQTMLFYCQTFYEYFRRPPILPCILPS